MNFLGLSMNPANPEAAANLLFLLTTVITGLSTIVANTQKKLKENTVRLIEQAEERFNDPAHSGADKQQYVVEMLYRQVPLLFRPFFPKKLLEKLASNTFGSVHRFSELRSANLVYWGEQEELARQKNSPQSQEKERKVEQDASKINLTHQPMPGNGVLQNHGLQGAVRVFSLRGRHGLLFRAEYRVCERKRGRRGGGTGLPAGQCRDRTL